MQIGRRATIHDRERTIDQLDEIVFAAEKILIGQGIRIKRRDVLSNDRGDGFAYMLVCASDDLPGFTVAHVCAEWELYLDSWHIAARIVDNFQREKKKR